MSDARGRWIGGIETHARRGRPYDGQNSNGVKGNSRLRASVWINIGISVWINIGISVWINIGISVWIDIGISGRNVLYYWCSR